MKTEQHHTDDDFAVGMVDLNEEEGEGTGLLTHLRGVFKLSLRTPTEEDEDEDDCEFDVRFMDLPSFYGGQDDLPDNLQESNTLITDKSPLRKLWRFFSPFHLLFILVLLCLGGSTMPRVTTFPMVVYSQSPQLFNTDGSLHISGFDAASQVPSSNSFTGWYINTGNSLTISIEGVVSGHAKSLHGSATWWAAALPRNCFIQNYMATPFVSEQLGVWLVGHTAPYTAIHLPTMTTATLDSWHGWQLMIGGAIGHDFIGPLTLTLINQAGGLSPSFTPIFSQTSINSMRFDPSRYPSRIMQKALHNRLLWTIPIYLPGAGCYTIRADWPGGSHLIYLVAGR